MGEFGGMLISVIICTYNRAALLDRALESLAVQSRSAPFEVVVVDNNSTDQTQQVLQKWVTDGGLVLKVIVEEKQGLSYARNAGIGAARGDVIAFIDDDVVVNDDWVLQLMSAFSQHPEVDCVGGPVDPDWETTPVPIWMNEELLLSVGVGCFGTSPKLLTGKEYPIGANMAFRTTVLTRIGQFDPRLGRIGTSLLSCEEVEFIDRLRRQGGKVLYHPTVCVRHFIPAARMTQPYFLKRRRWDGRSIALWELIQGGRRLLVRNALLRVFYVIPRDAIGWVLTTLIGHHSRRFTYTCRLAKTVAYLGQALRNLLCSSRSS